MKRTESQRVMDAARGDLEGHRRQEAWAQWCGRVEEANSLQRGPPPDWLFPAAWQRTDPRLFAVVHDSVFIEVSAVDTPAMDWKKFNPIEMYNRAKR